MYSWTSLVKETDLVLKGYVVSATLIEYPDDSTVLNQPQIELKIKVEETLYNKNSLVIPKNRFTLYLTGVSSSVPVGEKGAFFLTCQKICKSVDHVYAAWLIVPKYVRKKSEKSFDFIQVYDFDKLLIAKVPEILWTNYVELKDIDGNEQQTSKSFVTVESLSKKLHDLLTKT